MLNFFIQGLMFAAGAQAGKIALKKFRNKQRQTEQEQQPKKITKNTKDFLYKKELFIPRDEMNN